MDISKLKNNGYYTIAVSDSLTEAFAVLSLTESLSQSVNIATKKKLENIKGFSETKVEKIKEAVKKCAVSLVPCHLHRSSTDNTLQPSSGSFMTALDLADIRKRVIRVSTGSKQLDAMVGGCVLLLVTC